jgi:hypothetical protein
VLLDENPLSLSRSYRSRMLVEFLEYADPDLVKDFALAVALEWLTLSPAESSFLLPDWST